MCGVDGSPIVEILEKAVVAVVQYFSGKVVGKVVLGVFAVDLGRW